MRARSDTAPSGRTREALIFGAFALICVAGALSVLVPETQGDRNEDGAPGAAPASTTTVDAPVGQARAR